ncbi:MAG: Gfo/Idh/MocA family oxidoreductase [Planctomycetes bacterium]|nr:Gfo/Idh/MocA family oxidoreductase [Planctomycetota bacterium]
MSEPTQKNPSRREFLQHTGRLAATATLAASLAPRLFAGENNTIQVVLIGCGGRGTGAADNALSVKNGPTKLVAMSDVFEDKLSRSYKSLVEKHAAKMDVPEDRRFLGFDGYKKAMDCLRPGDVAIFATPPAFRWVHFQYALQKGINVFMEKPVTVDGPTTKRMFQLSDEADRKNIKVGVGLMVRHCRGRQELLKRIRDGAIGDILLLRGYRMSGRSALTRSRPSGMSELLWQIRSFHAWIWASGGCFSDYYIHQIDECSWMKGAWPTEAHALGGRHFRGDSHDQNLDTYAVEYTYPDGTKLFYQGRNMQGCQNAFCSFAHGTRGSAVISTSGHTPGKVRSYQGHLMEGVEPIWRYTWAGAKNPGQEESPYQLEWDDLIDAIRNNKPYNEAKRGAEASLVTSMGRMAAHTGNTVTYQQMLDCPHEMAPDVDKFTMDFPAPVRANAEGKYPAPEPGTVTDREYKESA